ncbi:MAG: hypothetical protein J6Q24_05515 [Clostridia bacterium]|nr:hypothetical protein [Clostridia bacterium]
MKNFIFSCVAISVIICLTALSAFFVNGYTEKTVDFINAGSYKEALDYYYMKESLLSLVINGGELERMEEALIDLSYGVEGAKEKAVSVCKELASRERLILY